MTKLNRMNLIRNKYTGIKVDNVMMRALLISNYDNWKQNISTPLNDVTNRQARLCIHSAPIYKDFPTLYVIIYSL